MNFLGSVALISGIIGFACSHRYFNTKSFRIRISACFLFGVLAIPTILFASYYLHILPERAWFYTLRSWSGSELFAVFLGAAGGVLATLLPRFILVIPLGLTVLTASVPYLKMIMNPLRVADLKDRWEGAACLQSTESTCGPASSASILRFLGEDASESEIARSAYSTASGTEAWYLARYFRARGLTPKFDFHSTFVPSIPMPSIVGVRLGSFGHFIAVLKISDGIVTFVDPLSGKRELKTEEVLRAYTLTGFHLSITNTMPNKTVVATADNVSRSLRSGRPASAVPHL